MTQWINFSSGACAEPVSSKIFMVSLDPSLPFGYGLVALHLPLLCTSGADRTTSQQIYTIRGLETSSVSHQRQLCHALGEHKSTLPASQEAMKDLVLFWSSSVWVAFTQALPPALGPSPERERPELWVAHAIEESQDTAGRKKSQNKCRRKGVSSLATVGPGYYPEEAHNSQFLFSFTLPL